MGRRLALGLLVAICATHANADDWLEVGNTDALLWQARTGSGVMSKNRGGKPLVVAAGRIYDKSAKSYNFVKWYVTLDHCAAGSGKLVTLNNDSEFKYENDFVFKGGSVASSIAETLCGVATSIRQEDSDKGI